MNRAMRREGLAALLLIAACGPSRTPAPAVPRPGAAATPCPAPGEAVIRGQVRDAETGDAVFGATILVSRAGRAGTRWATTDKEGWYEMGGLLPDTYEIAVHADGMEEERREVQAGSGPSTVAHEVERARRPEIIILRGSDCSHPSSCRPRATDMLFGRVVEPGDWPVGKARVLAEDARDPAIWFEARSDDGGWFYLGLVPPGTYHVMGMSEGREVERRGVEIADGQQTEIVLELPAECPP